MFRRMDFSWLIIIALGMEYCDGSPYQYNYEKHIYVIKETAKCEAQQKVAMTEQCTSICSPDVRDALLILITGDLYTKIQWPICFAFVRSTCFAYTFQNSWTLFAISLSLPSCNACSLFDSTTEMSYEIHHTVFNKLMLNINFVRHLMTLNALDLNTLRQMHCYIITEHFTFIGFILILDRFSLSHICSFVWNTLVLNTENKLLFLGHLGFDLFIFWHIMQYQIYYYYSYYDDIQNISVSQNDGKIMCKTNNDNLNDFYNDHNSADLCNEDYLIGELSDSKNVSGSIGSDSANDDCFIRITDDRNFVDLSTDSISAEKGYNADFISSQNNDTDIISPNEYENNYTLNTDGNIDCSNENDHKESANDYLDSLNDEGNISLSNDDDDIDSSNDENQFGSVFVTDIPQQEETCKVSLSDHQNFSNSHCSENSTDLSSVMSSRRLVCNIIENPAVDLKSDSLENESKPDLKSDTADDELKKILRLNTSLQNSDQTRFQQMLTVLPVNKDPKQKTDSTKRIRRSLRQREQYLATGRSNSANESTSYDRTDQVLSPLTNDRSHNDNLALSNERGNSNNSNSRENVPDIVNGENLFQSVDEKQGLDSCQGRALKSNHKHRRHDRTHKSRVPCQDEADSLPLLRARNGIRDALPVEKSHSSKFKCYELSSAVQETKPDQTELSQLGACGGDPFFVGYGTEETQIVDAEIEVDGVGDTAQETSQNQAVQQSSRTNTQTPPEETTHLQNRRQDVFPDPAVDDSDLQRFEPMMAIIDKIAVGERVAPQITMRYEMLRLCTLRSFPKENKPFIIRIAQAGFYYANSGDEVVCYCCAKRKSGWRETDVPLDVHRQLNPNCRFLMSNSEVNVSVRRQETLASRRSVSTARVTSASDDTEISANSDREQNSIISVFRRSPAQFGNATTSQNSLQALTSSVAAPGQPSTVSQPYSTSTSGLTSTVHTTTTTTAHYNSQATPVRSPKYPAYVTLATRQASIRDCSELVVPTDTLAEAGFFYAGFGDCCRCFQCGVGLRHWSAEDDPWIEHSRWSRNCSYVREKKGEEFINLVQMAVEYQQNEQRSQEQQLSVASRSGERAGSPNVNVDNLLHTDAAQSVLEMGYGPEMIRTAIQVVLDTGFTPSSINAALLMEKICALEESNSSQASAPLAPTTKESLALAPTPGASLAPTSQPSASKPPHNQSEMNQVTVTQSGTCQNADGVTSPELEGATAAPSVHASRKMPSVEQKKLREENARMKQQTICTKCKQNDVSIVFLPCGHLVTCEQCAETVRYCTERNCGKYIKGTVRTYAV